LVNAILQDLQKPELQTLHMNSMRWEVNVYLFFFIGLIPLCCVDIATWQSVHGKHC